MVGTPKHRKFRNVAWRPEEIKRIGELLLSMTSSQVVIAINKEFNNGRTKSSVLSAAKRYLPDMPLKEKKDRIPSEFFKNAVHINKKVYGRFKDIPHTAYGKKCHLLDIKPNRCRYPLPDYHCCNAKAKEDSSYCAKHHAFCYQDKKLAKL